MFAFDLKEYLSLHSSGRLLQWPAVALCLACFGVAAQAPADSGPMACVREVEAPRFLGDMRGLPARVEVTVELGANGKVTSVTSNAAVGWIKAEMDLAFMTRAQYLDTCHGKKLKFVVSYLVEGSPTDKPISQTTIRMPNEFVVRCNPMLSTGK
jgi:hypothetical protein